MLTETSRATQSLCTFDPVSAIYHDPQGNFEKDGILVLETDAEN